MSGSRIGSLDDYFNKKIIPNYGIPVCFVGDHGTDGLVETHIGKDVLKVSRDSHISVHHITYYRRCDNYLAVCELPSWSQSSNFLLSSALILDRDPL